MTVWPPEAEDEVWDDDEWEDFWGWDWVWPEEDDTYYGEEASYP